MNHFFVITNHDKDKEDAVTNRICEYLKQHGKDCRVREREALKTAKNSYSYTDPKQVPVETDCIITVGGDGTLIQAARDLVDRKIPIIGINLGHLGYLTQGEEASLDETLSQLVAGNYQIQSRMMISGTVIRKGNTIGEQIALNDIVISRCGILELLPFAIYVNGRFLYEYRADGMIIATPTGSTAYNLSAGGPIVSPEANILVLTPICSHTLNTRSIVLSAEDTVEIEIRKGSKTNQDRMIAYDGDDVLSLESQDLIRIRKSDRVTSMIQIGNLSFLETLGQKMSSNESKR